MHLVMLSLPGFTPGREPILTVQLYRKLHCALERLHARHPEAGLLKTSAMVIMHTRLQVYEALHVALGMISCCDGQLTGMI